MNSSPKQRPLRPRPLWLRKNRLLLPPRLLLPVLVCLWPRSTRAALSLAVLPILVLYALFFLPGIGALTWAGWTYFHDALAIHEQTFNATPLPVYPFKFVIPLAGVIVMLQGLSEIVRCVVCIRTGAWTPRLKDAQESDVVAQQLAGSEYVDDEARQLAIEQSKTVRG
mgnify:CR=1 FL=1